MSATTFESAEVFTTGNIAELTGMVKQTIQELIDSGKIKGHRLPTNKPNRHRRVYRADLIRFLRENGMDEPLRRLLEAKPEG